jgi:NADPH2:quinone reductase
VCLCSSSAGASVVFDPVGGDQFNEAMKAASPWGSHYLVIGFAAGQIPKVRVSVGKEGQGYVMPS